MRHFKKLISVLLLSFVLCLFINGCYAQTPAENKKYRRLSFESSVFLQKHGCRRTHSR